MDLKHLEDELKQRLSQHIFFSHLDQESLRRLIKTFEMMTCTIGQTILTEGETADAAYLVWSGKVRVLKQGPDGKPITLATLGPGEFLGEHGLLKEEHRSASARAAQDTVLFRIDRDRFVTFVDEQPALRPMFEKLIHHRAFARFLQSATFLGTMPAKDIAALLDQFSMRNFAEGDAIVREGEPGDQMFVITAGEVKVQKGAGADATVLSYLGPGDYFGERALLTQEPRYATAVALSAIECAALSRDDFDALLASAPKLREELVRRFEDYAAGEEAARRFGVRAPVSAEAAAIEWQTVADDESPRSVVLFRGRHRWFGLKKSYPFIPQEDETDCGAASLAMIARYHNVRLSIERLRDLAHVGTAGASGWALMQAAEKIGYDCRPVQTDFDHLAKLTLPAIAHWKGYHYLVLYEAAGDRVVLGDPAEGIVRISRAVFEAGWTGNLFELKPTERLGETAPSKSAFRWLMGTIKPQRRLLLAALGQSVLAAFLLLALALPIQAVMDAPPEQQSASVMMHLGGALLLGGAGVLLLLRGRFLGTALTQIGERLGLTHLQQALFWLAATLQTRSALSLLNNAETLAALQKTSFRRHVERFLNLILTVLGIAALGFFDLLSGIAAASVLLFRALFLVVHTKRTIAMCRQDMQAAPLLRSPWWRILNHRNALKQSASENAEIRRAGENAERLGAIRAGIAQRQSVAMFADGLVLLLLFVVVIFFGVLQFQSGQWSVGRFIAVAFLLTVAIAPVLPLLNAWPDIVRAGLWLQRFADLSDLALEQSPSENRQSPRLRGRVQFDDAGFRYSPEAPDALSHLNLNLAPGDFVWLVGRSGAGKSTLGGMLLGFHPPTTGTLKFEGHDINTIDLQHLRRHVQVVPEEPAIIHGSIRQNIALGNPDATMEQIINAAKLVDLHDVIMQFPLGYETPLLPPGIHLSLSQRQCICIARAVLADPRILILDEATAVLDNAMEQAVFDNLRWFGKGRSVIIMVRRPRRVLPDDQIIVLDEGRIVEQGTHAVLLRQKGLYSYLADHIY